jgi:hypothetical protein
MLASKRFEHIDDNLAPCASNNFLLRDHISRFPLGTGFTIQQAVLRKVLAMPSRERPHSDDKAPAHQPLPTSNTQSRDYLTRPPDPAIIIEQGGLAPHALLPRAVLQLQRIVGNRAVGKLLAAKSRPLMAQPPLVSAENRYEREADRLVTGSANVLQQASPIQRELKLDGADTVQGNFQRVDRADNKTGLPDDLKAGVENLSGISLSAVRVHYNSNAPEQLDAAAYTQGMDIHVGPGQEQHLPHEAWHVVQQTQGRVKPTLQTKGAAVNDDRNLEREADVMGARAIEKAAQFGEASGMVRLSGEHEVRQDTDAQMAGGEGVKGEVIQGYFVHTPRDKRILKDPEVETIMQEEQLTETQKAYVRANKGGAQRRVLSTWIERAKKLSAAPSQDVTTTGNSSSSSSGALDSGTNFTAEAESKTETKDSKSEAKEKKKRKVEALEEEEKESPAAAASSSSGQQAFMSVASIFLQAAKDLQLEQFASLVNEKACDINIDLPGILAVIYDLERGSTDNNSMVAYLKKPLEIASCLATSAHIFEDAGTPDKSQKVEQKGKNEKSLENFLVALTQDVAGNINNDVVYRISCKGHSFSVFAYGGRVEMIQSFANAEHLGQNLHDEKKPKIFSAKQFTDLMMLLIGDVEKYKEVYQEVFGGFFDAEHPDLGFVYEKSPMKKPDLILGSIKTRMQENQAKFKDLLNKYQSVIRAIELQKQMMERYSKK